MPTANVSLQLYERNDETVDHTVTRDGQPFDLTGKNLEFILKARTQDLDTAGVILTDTDGDITVTDPAGGLATTSISSEHLASPGRKVWRLDVLDGTDRKTAIYGQVTIVDL